MRKMSRLDLPEKCLVWWEMTTRTLVSPQTPVWKGVATSSWSFSKTLGRSGARGVSVRRVCVKLARAMQVIPGFLRSYNEFAYLF